MPGRASLGPLDFSGLVEGRSLASSPLPTPEPRSRQHSSSSFTLSGLSTLLSEVPGPVGVSLRGEGSSSRDDIRPVDGADRVDTRAFDKERRAALVGGDRGDALVDSAYMVFPPGGGNPAPPASAYMHQQPRRGGPAPPASAYMQPQPGKGSPTTSSSSLIQPQPPASAYMVPQPRRGSFTTSSSSLVQPQTDDEIDDGDVSLTGRDSLGNPEEADDEPSQGLGEAPSSAPSSDAPALGGLSPQSSSVLTDREMGVEEGEGPIRRYMDVAGGAAEGGEVMARRSSSRGGTTSSRKVEELTYREQGFVHRQTFEPPLCKRPRPPPGHLIFGSTGKTLRVGNMLKRRVDTESLGGDNIGQAMI
eukprot:gene18292-24752_t